MEAAKKLAMDPATFNDVRALLRQETRADTRHALTYALSWHDDPRSWPILLHLLSDPRENPRVRGQAAEGLAYHFHRKRKGSMGYDSAVRALVAALKDPSPEVRYFSIFALGASRDRRVLPELRKLRRDRARSKFGMVGEEAEEAILVIERGNIR